MTHDCLRKNRIPREAESGDAAKACEAYFVMRISFGMLTLHASRTTRDEDCRGGGSAKSPVCLSREQPDSGFIQHVPRSASS